MEKRVDGNVPPLKPLRIWMPISLLVGMLIARYLPNAFQDGPAMLWMFAAFGPLLLGLMLMFWWLAFSRASWFERAIGLLGVVVAFALTLACLDSSMMGPPIMVLTIPMGTAAFAVSVIACSRVLSVKRTWVGIAAAFLGFGFSTLLQSDGMWGNFALGLDWRWNATSEEQFLASRAGGMRAEMVESAVEALESPVWPGFRGPNRDSVQHGTFLDTDWERQPPEEIWRIQVGPAWSSFAVAGNLLFTQEQRGAFESVVCYAADSGAEVWARELESRFSDALGGPGPRATPTIADGSIFAMGAEGWLTRLNAATGDIQWKVDLRQVADRDPPIWGFSSSPWVSQGVVIVHAGGKGEKGIVAFDIENGSLKWSTASGADSYGSLQEVDVAGQSLLAILTNVGVQFLDPRDGRTKLEYEWLHSGYRALQPQVVGASGVLIPTGMGSGTRMVEISADGEQLLAAEQWTSRNLKPDFNDLVVHQGYMYGFDGAIFACVDLADGSRKWKKGRYGKGQVLLLADSDLLLVVSETGEVVLLRADPSEHVELARLQALEGKTWNHPVVIGDRLYIRNASEAVCYRLPLRSEG